jgi:hypothetical protein
MKRILAALTGSLFVGALSLSITNFLRADDMGSSEALMPITGGDDTTTQDAAQRELSEAKQSLDSMSGLEELKPKSETDKTTSGKKLTRSAEAFVVGPDWEFDGFVAGGQDQNIKSMFAVNDLVYLNVGVTHGFHSGERVGIYRRGDKVRDPQNNRLIGYEVRKIAISEVSDRIEESNCSARILKSYEAVEVGDLVRREE